MPALRSRWTPAISYPACARARAAPSPNPLEAPRMRAHFGVVAAGLAGLGHPELVKAAQQLRPIGTLFLNLLSMVVIPLVATALFAGIARLGNLRRVSRLVVRTLAFFWGTALVAIVIGFLVGSIVLPHAVVSLDQQAALRAAAVADSGFIRKAA